MQTHKSFHRDFIRIGIVLQVAPSESVQSLGPTVHDPAQRLVITPLQILQILDVWIDLGHRVGPEPRLLCMGVRGVGGGSDEREIA